MRRRLAGLALALAIAGGVGSLPVPGAGGAVPVPTSAARLTGTFLLAGRVTVADNVAGEHRGQGVRRTWIFTANCPAGPCATVTLVRRRVMGTDRLMLRRTAPGYYVGYASFYRGLRCGSGIYRRGERVPFRITVRITQALVVNGQVLASRINASYRNQVRYNLTPCVAYLGHDAASYHGHVVAAS